jgi:hypothetical protein
VKVWTGFSWLRIVSSGSSEDDNEPSGFMKAGELTV